jgi:hypothetical protein
MMAFQPEPTRTPTAIGAITVFLKDSPERVEDGETVPAYKSAHFDVKVVLSDGTVVTRRGDLQPHLTQAQIDGLLAFMADLRAQAEEEILP